MKVYDNSDGRVERYAWEITTNSETVLGHVIWVGTRKNGRYRFVRKDPRKDYDQNPLDNELWGRRRPPAPRKLTDERFLAIKRFVTAANAEYKAIKIERERPLSYFLKDLP